jgi:fascin 1/2
VLRCEHGYVDKTASSKILCNRGSYDLIRLVNKGTLYQIGTSNGKFWCVDDDGSLVSKPNGELFTLELREHTKVVIKASNGNYLKGDHNGSITACAESVSDCTSWEL